MFKKFLVAVIVMMVGVSTMAQDAPVITPKGVGPVQIGVKLKDLPSKSKGVYDKIKTESFEQAEEGETWTTTYHVFYLGGKPALVTLDDEGGADAAISYVEVLSPAFKTPSGLSLNSTAQDILNAGGYVNEDLFNYNTDLNLVCDGFIWWGWQLTESGQKKGEDLYFGAKGVKVSAADFQPGTHATRICLGTNVFPSGYFVAQAKPASNTAAPMKKDTVISIIAILVLLLMVGHMCVEIFLPKKPLTIEQSQTSGEKEALVAELLEKASAELSPICGPNEEVTANTPVFPAGLSKARKIKKTLRLIYKSYRPVSSQESVDRYNFLGDIVADSSKRVFRGSKAYVFFAFVLAVVLGFITKDWHELIYVCWSSVLYIFASFVPKAVIIGKELKDWKNGKLGKDGDVFSKMIGGIFNLWADAPIYVTQYIRRDNNEVVYEEEDHSVKGMSFIISIVLMIVLMFAMPFIAIGSYIINYWIRKI